MTGPRVDPPGADKHGTPIMPRVLSPEEWEQAQGMGTKALTAQPFPYQPPAWKPDAAGRMGALRDGMAGAAPRDVTRTPMSPSPRGVKQKGAAGVVGNIVNPVLEHPWMTAGVLGAAAIPVVGPYVGLAMAGDMASNVALYGYQKYLEHGATPEARKIMEADPERVSGEAAIAQALMLGLAPLVHVGVKGARSLDVSKGMVEAGAKGVKEMPMGPDFAPDTPPSPGESTYLNKRFSAKLDAGAKRQGSPRDVAPVEGLTPSGDQAKLTSTPRHPSGFSVDNPFAPEAAARVKPLATETPAAALEGAAAKANDPMRPKRRPAPLETPQGAEMLGSVAARHGLDVESNPYPEGTPTATAWKNGHADAALDAEPTMARGTPSGGVRAQLDRMVANADAQVAGMRERAGAGGSSEPLPSYPEGMAMGGIEGRIPDVAKVTLSGERAVGQYLDAETAKQFTEPRAVTSDAPAAPPTVPKVAQPEAVASANSADIPDAKRGPKVYRTHTTDELTEAALDAQAAIEEAQKNLAADGEARLKDNENTGMSRGDQTAVYMNKGLTLDRAVKKMAKIEHEFALRGVRGTDLYDLMDAAREQRIERQAMQEEGALAAHTGADDPFGAEPAPVAEPVAAGDASAQAGTLAPVGTGETRTSGLAAAVERKAVVNKVATTLGELPEYRTMNVEEQAGRASDLLEADPALARRVALGEAHAPDGLHPEAVFVAVTNRAIAEGDVGTIRALATGKLTREGTAMGQRIRLLGELDPESPVAAIQNIIKVRMDGVQNVPRATVERVASLRAQLKDADATQKTWAEFVDSLRC